MPAVLIASAAVVLYFAIEGFRHGVVRRAVEIIGLIVIFLFASSLAHALEPKLADALGMSRRVAFFGSWIVVLVGGVVGVRLLAAGLSKVFRFSIVGWLDKGGGLVLGGLFGAVIASCLLVALLAAPVGDDLKDDVREHPATSALLYVAPAVYDVASEIWQGDSFREMVKEHIEPRAKDAVDGIKAFLDEVQEDGDEGEQR